MNILYTYIYYIFLFQMDDRKQYKQRWKATKRNVSKYLQDQTDEDSSEDDSGKDSEKKMMKYDVGSVEHGDLSMVGEAGRSSQKVDGGPSISDQCNLGNTIRGTRHR